MWLIDANRLYDAAEEKYMEDRSKTENVIAHRTTVLVDPKLGDYDTMAIWSAETPDGKRKEVGRFFKESNGKWLEIDKSEYMERFEMEGRRLGKD